LSIVTASVLSATRLRLPKCLVSLVAHGVTPAVAAAERAGIDVADARIHPISG
jgi:hypothetical protein